MNQAAWYFYGPNAMVDIRCLVSAELHKQVYAEADRTMWVIECMVHAEMFSAPVTFRFATQEQAEGAWAALIQKHQAFSSSTPAGLSWDEQLNELTEEED